MESTLMTLEHSVIRRGTWGWSTQTLERELDLGHCKLDGKYKHVNTQLAAEWGNNHPVNLKQEVGYPEEKSGPILGSRRRGIPKWISSYSWPWHHINFNTTEEKWFMGLIQVRGKLCTLSLVVPFLILACSNSILWELGGQVHLSLWSQPPTHLSGVQIKF